MGVSMVARRVGDLRAQVKAGPLFTIRAPCRSPGAAALSAKYSRRKVSAMGTDRALEGYGAFVSGGSGGIGSASARLLIRDGAAVLLMGRRADALEKTKARLLAEFPDAVIGIHAGDGAKKADVQEALKKAHALRGRLDILVPTVGGGGGYKPVL